MKSETVPVEGIAFGPYFLLGELGGGQMIEVWAAGQVLASGQRRPCVIKRVNPKYKDFTAPHSLIKREVELQEGLSHPNLIRLYDHGEIDGLTFVCLELIDGVALSQIGSLVSSPALPLGAVLEFGQRVSDALMAAHNADPGFGHGRLAPANVILGRTGELKVADIALATATHDQAHASLIPNTSQLGYFSPEQLKDLEHTPAADLFALGVILVEITTGRRLFPDGTSIVEDQEALVRRLCSKSPAGDLPASLIQLLVDMTRFETDSRIASLELVSQELRTIALANDYEDSIASHLNRDVFVRLPQLDVAKESSSVRQTIRPDTLVDDVPIEETDGVREALLGSARAPEKQVLKSSFPTTGAILLEQITYEQTLEFELPSRLPSSALMPMVPVAQRERDEPTIPPLMPAENNLSDELEEGTYRILGKGLEVLLSYDPYLRAINLVETQVEEAKNAQIWEFYFKFGDDVGPRIIRKSLVTRIYRDQQVILLEGSNFYLNSVHALIEESTYLPRGIMSARGESVIVDMSSEKAEEFFLATHERRVPRPSLSPTSPASDDQTRDRLFRFFSKEK